MKLNSINKTGRSRWIIYISYVLSGVVLLHRSPATNGNEIKRAANLPCKPPTSLNELKMLWKRVWIYISRVLELLWWNSRLWIHRHKIQDLRTSSSLTLFSKLWTNVPVWRDGLIAQIGALPRSGWYVTRREGCIIRHSNPPEPHLRQRPSPGEGAVKLNIYSHLLNNSQYKHAVMLWYTSWQISSRCCENNKKL